MINVGMILLLISCQKEATYSFRLDNNTKHPILSAEFSIAGDEIKFPIDSFSQSDVFSLNFRGREVVNPQYLNLSVRAYKVNDSIIMNTIGHFFDRTKLSIEQVNEFEILVDDDLDSTIPYLRIVGK